MKLTMTQWQAAVRENAPAYRSAVLADKSPALTEFLEPAGDITTMRRQHCAAVRR